MAMESQAQDTSARDWQSVTSRRQIVASDAHSNSFRHTSRAELTVLAVTAIAATAVPSDAEGTG